MRVKLVDDNQNWLNWGRLVEAWIDGIKPRPTTVKDLKAQMAAASVEGVVDGADTRQVNIMQYNDVAEYPLTIYIPTKKMRDAKLATVKPGPYPLPLFYDIAYAGAPRAKLSPQEARDLASRRIGEYTINECC